MTRLEAYLIEQSKLLAPNCDGRARHMSFICVRNRVVSIGLNSYNKTHPLAKRFGHKGANIHSELAAIVNAPKGLDLDRCTMYNVRIRPGFRLVGLSKPCSSCQKLIIAFGIGRVRYTTNEGVFEIFV